MNTHVARQPIFDLNNHIYGYELLYRSTEGVFDGDIATSNLLSYTLTTIGVDKITNGFTAFVNFTKRLLLNGLPKLLDPAIFVVEILEDTIVDDHVIDCVKNLKESGYILAVDDYIGDPQVATLFPYIDIIKVDFKQIDVAQRKQIAEDVRPLSKILLAEKVETEEEYNQAVASGYTLFQGYYFQRPVVVQSDMIYVYAQNSTCLKVFGEISSPEINFEKLSRIINTDISLSYKLLRHIGTAQYYRGSKITTVKQALVRMGIQEIRRWFSFIFLEEVGGGESSTEQAHIALFRGVFVEKVVAHMGREDLKNDAYMTGIFSMLSTLVEKDFGQLLDCVSVSETVKLALVEHKGILFDILEFSICYERAYWEKATEFILKYNLDDDVIAKSYIDAIAYADDVFGVTHSINL